MTKQKARKATPRDIEIGFRVRQKRQGKNISQTEIANKVGVKYQQIQKYESGRDRMSAITLDKIAKALDCTVDELLNPANESDSRNHQQVTNKQDIDAVARNLWNGLKSPRDKRVVLNLMESLHEITPVQPPGTVKRDL